MHLEPPAWLVLHELRAAILFQPLLHHAQLSSEITHPPNVSLSFPLLLAPRLCSTPGIDLGNRGLNCVCLINGCAGSAQDCSCRPESGWKWLRGRLGAQSPGWAEDIGALPSSHPVHWGPGGSFTHCPSGVTTSGAGANGNPGEPKRVLEGLPPPFLFSQMRLFEARLLSDLPGTCS